MLAKAIERDGQADRVAVEEPLEIRVGGEPLAVTMRTPGHDGALDEVAVLSSPLPHGPVVALELLAALPDRLAQPGCVSGRLSFELVQKAAVAGAPILVGGARRRRWPWRLPTRAG